MQKRSKDTVSQQFNAPLNGCNGFHETSAFEPMDYSKSLAMAVSYSFYDDSYFLSEVNMHGYVAARMMYAADLFHSQSR